MRASLACRLADGTDGPRTLIEGTLMQICLAVQGCLGAHNASLVWATDARTGALLVGCAHDGCAVRTLPMMQHGFFTENMRTIYPPDARILERDEQHTYVAVRGFSATVLVYASGGWCIGVADPRDLGFADAAAMLAAGVAS